MEAMEEVDKESPQLLHCWKRYTVKRKNVILLCILLILYFPLKSPIQLQKTNPFITSQILIWRLF